MEPHCKSPRLSFWLPPSTPKSNPGHDPGKRMKFLFNMFSIENTKFEIKIFETDMLMIFDLLTSPQGHQFAVARPIHVSNSHTKFGWISSNGLGGQQREGIWFCPLSTTRAWPRWQIKNPVWYVLYLSFVRTHTKFGIKIFEIDFVIKWYLTFWPLWRGKRIALARPIHVSNSHSKFGWISSNGLGGEYIKDGRRR